MGNLFIGLGQIIILFFGEQLGGHVPLPVVAAACRADHMCSARPVLWNKAAGAFALPRCIEYSRLYEVSVGAEVVVCGSEWWCEQMQVVVQRKGPHSEVEQRAGVGTTV